MRPALFVLLAVAALLSEGCGAAIVSTHHNGWHECPGTPKGCTANELCSKFGCRWWGEGADPTSQGSGDIGGAP